MPPVTITDIFKLKENKQKILMLTAYNYPMARILDNSDIHIILVGDSLGMTALGYESTIHVTMEDMERAVASVARGSSSKLIVADMPFLSYNTGAPEAVRNAGRLMKAGAHCVKVEGAQCIEEISAIIKAGIPVIGHLGFTPQSVNKLGGYKVQGKTESDADKIKKDAKLLQDMGVFAIVLEMIPATLAKKITESIAIPTIGIGAGAATDGQVLVTDDILGLFDKFTPKFVKKFAGLNETIRSAVNDYCKDVEQGNFPGTEHSFS